eukprot:69081-Pyramimonas_sp.AAC.1
MGKYSPCKDSRTIFAEHPAIHRNTQRSRFTDIPTRWYLCEDPASTEPGFISSYHQHCRLPQHQDRLSGQSTLGQRVADHGSS